MILKLLMFILIVVVLFFLFISTHSVEEITEIKKVTEKFQGPVLPDEDQEHFWRTGERRKINGPGSK